MNSKLKVYFYSPGFANTRPVTEFANRDKVVFINPTPLYLDSYMKVHEPELQTRVEWTKMQYLPLTKQEFIDEINNLEVDVVALSIYTWNKANILDNVKDIHQHLKRPTKFIIGGPSVNVVRDPTYLQNLPEVEFAIYAQGEVPFVSVVKHYLGIQKVNVLNTKNLAWIDNGKLKKADYEFTRIKSGSPIVQSRDLLERIRDDLHPRGWIIHFPYETSRGCPYNCAFCDWTSGMSHKVSKRKFAYEEELETLGELGITNLYMADANFGMFPEDVQIAETMGRLKKEMKYDFWIHGNNFSKTKKDIVFKIADIFVESNIVPYMKFSIQDIDDTVLDNIARPDIPWEEHIKYILALRAKYPSTIIALDIIKGLPGQTRQSWENIYKEICQHDLQLDVYDWEIIANSPAGYDKEYQERMQLKTITTVDYSDSNRTQEDVISTISYDIRDYAYFTVLYQIYNIYFRNHVPAFPRFIEMIKTSDKLDKCLDSVVANITDKTKVRRLIKDFMLDLLKANFKSLNKNFVKMAYGKKDINRDGDSLIVEIVHHDKSNILKEVFN